VDKLKILNDAIGVIESNNWINLIYLMNITFNVEEINEYLFI